MAVSCLQSPFVFCGIWAALRSAHHPPLWSRTLRLHHLPHLPLGAPSSCKAYFGSMLALFSTSLWNVASLRGIISQGARKEHGTAKQKNHCNADNLLMGKNLHHQQSKQLVSFN